MQEVSFIGFESNWQSVLVFFFDISRFSGSFRFSGTPHIYCKITLTEPPNKCRGRRRTCRFKTGQRCEIRAFKLARIPHTKHLDTEPM